MTWLNVTRNLKVLQYFITTYVSYLILILSFRIRSWLGYFNNNKIFILFKHKYFAFNFEW